MTLRRLLAPLAVAFSFYAPALDAQSPGLAHRLTGVVPRDRIVEPIDSRDTVRLSGTVNPLSRSAFDGGRLPADRVIPNLQLVLRRDVAQETSLQEVLAEQQDPRSPIFHQWLTPESFGAHFGVSQRDVDLVVDWLQSQGLTVDQVPSSKLSISFSGTAARVAAAFQTELHSFEVEGESYFANVSEQHIPRALTAISAGVLALDDFDRMPNPLRRAAELHPSYSIGWPNFILAPSDFATIYNLQPLYDSAITGAGQSIAIVGTCTIDPAVPDAFRALTGLTANPVHVQIAGPAPNCTGTPTEAYMDVELSAAAARDASVTLVAATSVATAVTYIVDNNVADIVSVSYGQCEQRLGGGLDLFYSQTWQQAAGQGISVFVSSGDEGAAGCDITERSSPPAISGLGVNGICSTPYDVCVGGTVFNDTDNPFKYWNFDGTAIGYIPESVWNDSAPAGSKSPGLWSSGGGYSYLYSEPSWQPGTSPYRGVPDVSLSAAAHDGYQACLDAVHCTSSYYWSVYGTSASAPSFAGIMALVDQVAGGRQGNPNPTLYQLAARKDFGTIFHDVVTGNNSVPGQTGYSAGPGWDEATGLGSVDAYALATHWSAVSAKPATFSAQRMTATPPPADNSTCAAPPDAGSFDNTAAGTVWLFFNSIVSTGDQLSADFLAPDGTSMFPFTWKPVNGSLCGYAPATISPLSRERLGSWQARLFDNGLPIFSLPFTVTGNATDPPAITSVANAEGDRPVVAPNTWVSIKGKNLAAAGHSRIWDGSDFVKGQMPTSLDGVSVTVNGIPAYVYYVSPTQVNVLTPPDDMDGAGAFELTVRGTGAASRTAIARSVSPSFFVYNGGPYVVAEHASGSLIGPASLYPGLTTPAAPGETIVLFANGFGTTDTPVTSGAQTQSGQLPTPPAVRIGGIDANVTYAGLTSPGLYQFNVVVPDTVPSGDASLTATYNGSITQAGVMFTIR